MSDLKEFYGPHPGFAGAGISIPAEVRRVAEGLVGKKMTIEEAIDKIKNVSAGTVRDVVDHSYISLVIERWGITHRFRVIWYR